MRNDMYGINRATLLGNVTKDPELRTTSGGKSVLNVSMATNESFTDASGEKREQTAYHTVVVWGRMADDLAKVLRKGDPIFVEGRIATRSWEKDGKKHYATEISALSLQRGVRNGAAERDAGQNKPRDEHDDIPF